MANIPPSPKRLRYLKREIARRYARKKVKPAVVAIRIRDLIQLMKWRYRGKLIDNNLAGRDFVTIVAHHLAHLNRDPRVTIQRFIAENASWMTIAEQHMLILSVFDNPQRWKADSLAWRLRLTMADRTSLCITTIGAIDCNKAQRAKRRKELHRKNARLWRIENKRNR